jgi:hypothetical protein
MSVYVDNVRIPFGRMRMSHMIADTSDELHAFAGRLGIERRWIQNPGTPREHYDVSISKRREALALGAREVSSKEIVQRMQAAGQL